MGTNTKDKLRIFISYSREDEPIVDPVVKLLRVTESKVFLDVDSVEPGEEWEDELTAALSIADKVCVFWCQHSASSEWVAREWRFAVEHRKKIIPLLLDSTPLVDDLTAYQYIDFRGVIEGSTHPTEAGYFYPSAPPPPGWTPESEHRLVAEWIVEQLLPVIAEQ